MKFKTCIQASVALAAMLSSLPAVAAPPKTTSTTELTPYSQPPVLDHLVLAPDGKHLALVNRDPYAIAIFDAEGRLQNGLPVNQTRIAREQWIDDTHLLAVRTGFQSVGDLLPTQLLHQAVVYDITDKKLRVPLKELEATATVLVDGPMTAGVWRSKPSLFLAAWGVGAELPNKSLYRYDIESGRSSIFDVGSFDAAEWALNPSGELLAKTTYDPSSDKWALLGWVGGHWKTIRSETNDRPPLLVGQGRSDGTIALVTDDELLEASATEGGPGVSIGPADSIVDGPLYDRKTGRLIGLRLAGEPPGYSFFDVDLQKAWAKTQRAFKGKRVTLIDFSADRKTLAVEVNDAGGPAAAYLIDVAAGRANLLGEERPDIAPDQLGKVSMIRYKARDGVGLTGVLTLPPGRGAEKLPLLVVMGSSPDSAADLGFDEEARFFASKGYAVFKPNTRGSKSSTQAFRRSGLGQYGKAMLTDIIDGVDNLAKSGAVDPGRVCITGDYYGAYAAVAAVTVQKQPWRCAVGYDGDYDLAWLTRQENQLVRGTGWQRTSLYARYVAGDHRPKKEEVAAIAPVNHAADSSAPILLVVRDESMTGRDIAMKMHAALDRAHKPNTITVLKKITTMVEPSSVQRLWDTKLEFLQKSNPTD